MWWPLHPPLCTKQPVTFNKSLTPQTAVNTFSILSSVHLHDTINGALEMEEPGMATLLIMNGLWSSIVPMFIVTVT